MVFLKVTEPVFHVFEFADLYVRGDAQVEFLENIQLQRDVEYLDSSFLGVIHTKKTPSDH